MTGLSSISPEMVARAVEGHEDALDQILQSLQGPLYNLALRMLLTHADAEDATQECLLRVVTRLSTFRGDSSFSTWAWRIAVRRILDFREGRFRHQMLSIEDWGKDLADGLDSSPADRVDQKLLVQQVKLGCGRALLQCLDADHRISYVLGEIMEMSGPEAAEILQISAATFRKRLSRARERVRNALHTYCGIVNPQATCRCHRRLSRAQTLGRLDSADGTATFDLHAVEKLVREVDELSQSTLFYRSDPDACLPAARLSELKRILQAGEEKGG